MDPTRLASWARLIASISISGSLAKNADLLKKAPHGDQYLTADNDTLDQGKAIFAERCARCHSSKLPEPVQGLQQVESCAGANYLSCWNRYWAWTKTDDFKQRMISIVKAPDFLSNNYLSTDLRVPVTLLQTNACSPLATNALGGNIWDNFSSHSYKSLPSVGNITVKDPFTGKDRQYRMPAGGRGYTRPPSLISVWSTAPYLLNNSIGKFNSNPSVEGRLESFTTAIEQLLWPERRARDERLAGEGVYQIERTTKPGWLLVPRGYLPGFFPSLRWLISWLLPGSITDTGDLRIGPIPQNTPVGLLGSFSPLPEDTSLRLEISRGWELLKLFIHLRNYTVNLPPNSSNEEAQTLFLPVARDLYVMSKCPDYEVNRGRYFGTDFFSEEPGLGDSDKRALIEFIKTF